MSEDDKFGKGFLDELESMSNVAEKKPKKTSSVDEVESLLKTTLSEVGIDAEKIRASVKALEAEKKKEKEEMDKLDSLLEPIHQPPHDTPHETAQKVLSETAHKAMSETSRKPIADTVHEPVRQTTAKGLDRETVHEAAHMPLHETHKDVFFARAQEKPEIFEKPKPSDKDIFPPLPEKKPAAKPAPAIQRERLETPPKKGEGALFDSYAAEEPKKKFPVAAVVLAAVVVIGGASAALLLSKGKGNTTPPVNTIAAKTTAQSADLNIPTAAENTEPVKSVLPASNPTMTPATKTAQPAAGAPKAANTAKAPAEKTAAPLVTTQTGPAPESQGIPAEAIQPLVPVETPRVQEVKPAPNTTADNAAANKPAAAAPAPAEGPKKAKVGDLVLLDQVDTQPVVLQRTEAIYPPIGKRFGVAGTVIVKALVSETGDVIRTEIIRKIAGGANYGFEKASEDAVKKYKFKPAVKDGVNVKTWIPVTVVFQ